MHGTDEVAGVEIAMVRAVWSMGGSNTEGVRWAFRGDALLRPACGAHGMLPGSLAALTASCDRAISLE